ncbi:unnamed protein product [Cuscuta epithymum]|uniref:Uncharacterized protein n=1 Tax=Cuscuta epithymum TaxID=186058 RepID=A0AAV0DBR3_9ASTE|nr:unnamed protein product [Cuscuta epithymum]
MLAVQFPSQDSRPIIMSPRISFSHDVSPADMAVEHQNIRPSSPPPLSSSEFNFCVLRERFDRFSSADELFLDGKILPTEIKRGMGQQRMVFPPPPHPLPPQPLPPPQKQRWRLGRSSSLSCGTGTFCPFPLMSRSNSTGSSSPIAKRNYQKVSSSSSMKQSQNVSTGHHHHQKPPLKKLMNYSGMGINPVLNIPPGSFFRLPSFLAGGRDKNRKK